MLTPGSRLQANEAEVAAKVFDGEAIMINLSNGMYYSMDQVGASIWAMLADGHSLGEVAEAIGRSYDVADAQARADVERIAAELLAEDLVRVSDRAAPAPIRGPARPEKLPYEPPQLNTYRDMGDLLALDPPMPNLMDIAWKEPSELSSR